MWAQAPDQNRADSEPATGLRRLPDPKSLRFVAVLTATLWLACFALCYALLTTPVAGDNTGLMKLTESYGSLERVALWQRTLSWLPGGHDDRTFITWPKPLIAWTVRVAMISLFAIHAIALTAVLRDRDARPLRWLAGPIGAQVIMLMMVPSNADVFFYAITGDIANQGSNPYTTPLYDVADHPLYQYNHWVDMASVYGPVWTLISQAVMALTGPDPATAVLGFKILFGATAIAVAAGVYGTARLIGLAPAPATAAMVFVGWQPNLLIESAGQAHNDIIVIGLVLVAVALTIAGTSSAVRGGIVLATVSATVKYVTLPMVGLLALTRLDRRRTPNGWRRIVSGWMLDGLAIVAVLVAAFAPWWTGPSMLGEMLSEPGRLYSNPVWHAVASLVRLIDPDAASTFEAVTRRVAQVAAILAIVAIIAWFALHVWRTADQANSADRGVPLWTRPLIVSWTLVFGILAYVPVNTHAWYWTWPIVPIALLVAWDAADEPTRTWPMQRWLGPCLVITAILTLVYHTRIVHT